MTGAGGSALFRFRRDADDGAVQFQRAPAVFCREADIREPWRCYGGFPFMVRQNADVRADVVGGVQMCGKGAARRDVEPRHRLPTVARRRARV
ncbi:hypothetical protein DSM19430T_24940 [Desulfovibrio psychrotolerans]|uniref:Uncharacterized protein n=1 Tax=Desulfovibrio psychrotolerans TaxID=415242 RepID=A0A7J0BVR1_9BACT|nr:hypothetical protein DSM19430T_24940 [Desulfovibrio psychrotolerans]